MASKMAASREIRSPTSGLEQCPTTPVSLWSVSSTHIYPTHGWASSACLLYFKCVSDRNGGNSGFCRIAGGFSGLESHTIILRIGAHDVFPPASFFHFFCFRLTYGFSAIALSFFMGTLAASYWFSYLLMYGMSSGQCSAQLLLASLISELHTAQCDNNQEH
jgi:hypothetical protein